MKNILSSLAGGADRRGGELIQIYSACAVYVEGVKRVLTVENGRIRLVTSRTVTVKGEGLTLKSLGDGNVCAEGRIDSVFFGEEP